MNALNVLCAQLTRDLFAIAKILVYFTVVFTNVDQFLSYLADGIAYQICNTTTVELPASPMYCCYTNLGKKSTAKY